MRYRTNQSGRAGETAGGPFKLFNRALPLPAGQALGVSPRGEPYPLQSYITFFLTPFFSHLSLRKTFFASPSFEFSSFINRLPDISSLSHQEKG
jgi:hypothetical protein